jgi:hypothetical protein
MLVDTARHMIPQRSDMPRLEFAPAELEECDTLLFNDLLEAFGDHY